MSASRSATPEVRNPVLALAAIAKLQALPLEARVALAAVLEELALDAHAKAERSWRQRKGPMAAYWRAVGVYARHTARATATAVERRQARPALGTYPLPGEPGRNIRPSGRRMAEYDEADEQLWGEAPPRDGADQYAREVDPFYRGGEA